MDSRWFLYKEKEIVRILKKGDVHGCIGQITEVIRDSDGGPEHLMIKLADDTEIGPIDGREAQTLGPAPQDVVQPAHAVAKILAVKDQTTPVDYNRSNKLLRPYDHILVDVLSISGDRIGRDRRIIKGRDPVGTLLYLQKNVPQTHNLSCGECTIVLESIP